MAQTAAANPPGTTVRVRSAMRSDAGRIRSENQDACAMAPELGLYAVVDGMGGAAGGELASNLALETFLESMGQSSRSAAYSYARDRMQDAVSAANLAVYTRAQKYRALRGMGTTLVAAVLEPSANGYTAWVANVGDSRCYLLKAGKLRQVTKDHSLVEEQIEAGLLRREHAESSPVRNVITRAIGPQAAVAADIAEVQLAQGDMLLLTSDGLTREVADEEIRKLLTTAAGDPDAGCEALVRAANAHGGRDNITVVLVACEQAQPLKLEGEARRMTKELYFDDFHVGQKFNSVTSYTVTAAEIKDFGQKYDPQPFHLDEAAGEASFFHGLAASGWLTAAIVMRLRVQSLPVSGGMIGAGAEEMRWTEPVRPGDTLRTEIEVTGLRIARSRPQYGIVTTTTNCYKQDDKIVMRATVNFLAPLRPAPAR